MVGTKTTSLTVDSLPALLTRMRAALHARRRVLNDLNVFPVPDGDTGTNMLATITAAAEATTPHLDGHHLDGGQSDGGHAHGQGDIGGGAPDADLAARIVRGAIHGARGNSGVILSQVLRAIVEEVATPGALDAQRYAAALGRARELAYEAVATPVEGTILTVIGAASDAAARAAARGSDLVATSAAACDAAGIAVARTRDQLDALRDAGVVDAGARGFELVLAAWHGHLTGDDSPVVLDPPRDGGTRPPHEAPRELVEVQYLLRADGDVAVSLRRALGQLGESVVVVGGGGLLNVHVHTVDVGAAIEAGTAHGRVARIDVRSLAPALAVPTAPPVAPPHAATPRATAVVAVLDGDGLVALADDQGAVTVPVVDGATPTVAALLVAIGRANATHVVLLVSDRAGQRVAFEAAEAAAVAGNQQVTVIEEATTPPAILAALAVFDPAAAPADTIAGMRGAAGGVRAGRVWAGRPDAASPATAPPDLAGAEGAARVGAKQTIASVDGDVVAVDPDPVQALGALAVALDAPAGELVTLFVGAQVGATQRAAAERCVRSVANGGDSAAPDVEVVDAGHQDAWFWLGVE